MVASIPRAHLSVREKATVVKTSHCMLECIDECEEVPTVTFYPCGHQVTCRACWASVKDSITTCPMGDCGQKITHFSVEGEADAPEPANFAENAGFLNSIRATLAAEKPPPPPPQESSGTEGEVSSSLRPSHSHQEDESTAKAGEASGMVIKDQQFKDNIRALLAKSKSATGQQNAEEPQRRVRFQENIAGPKRKRGVIENLPPFQSDEDPAVNGKAVFSAEFLASVRTKLETDFKSAMIPEPAPPGARLLKAQSTAYIRRAKEAIHDDITKRRELEADVMRRVVTSANGKKRVPPGVNVTFVPSLSWPHRSERMGGVTTSVDSRMVFLEKVRDALRAETRSE